ncbi:MAG: FISUMP domain-containing protein [Patescibacteria group bacterium]|nr:MAG: FISUMP domain-containing protein [Patescibacteria group bacterium]
MLYKQNKENQKIKKTPQRFEVFNSGVGTRLNSMLNSKLNKKLYNNKAFILQSNKTVKAFTLIELLVVIAIIGILSTLVVVALGNSRTSARDAKRLNDLKAMANALELYYADNNEYPSSITPGQPLEQGGVVYMNKVPENPTPRTDGICPDSEYTYTEIAHKPGHYQFSGCIGSSSGSFTAGPVSYQTDAGVINCGGQITDLDGNIYNTVQIGSQCWMKENMNIGTMLASAATMPSNDNIIEKWCFNNSTSNCGVTPAVNHGGLYTWAEAMNLPTTCLTTDCSAQIQTPHQGICPDGFHIPTDQEFNTLEQYTVATIASTANQYSCTLIDSYARCGDDNGTNGGGPKGAGKSLKKVGQGSVNGAGDDLVGFSAILSGYRTTGDLFSNLSSTNFFWSSLQSSSVNARYRSLNTGFSTILRYPTNKGAGFSVRCLKDS